MTKLRCDTRNYGQSSEISLANFILNFFYDWLIGVLVEPSDDSRAFSRPFLQVLVVASSRLPPGVWGEKSVAGRDELNYTSTLCLQPKSASCRVCQCVRNLTPV